MVRGVLEYRIPRPAEIINAYTSYSSLVSFFAIDLGYNLLINSLAVAPYICSPDKSTFSPIKLAPVPCTKPLKLQEVLVGSRAGGLA